MSGGICFGANQQPFPVPLFFPENRGLQCAFERGFHCYVYRQRDGRSRELSVGEQIAHRRYRRQYGVQCFMQGWMVAANMDVPLKERYRAK